VNRYVLRDFGPARDLRKRKPKAQRSLPARATRFPPALAHPPNAGF
jgi:hypothetical protein